MSLFRATESRAMTSDSFPWADSGLSSVSRERALSVVPFYAGVRLIAETVSSLPIGGHRNTSGGRIQIDTPRFIREPIDGSTTPEWLQRGLTSALVQGAACGHVTNVDRMGRPDGVIWVNPDRVRLVVERPKVSPTFYLDGREIDSKEMIYVPAFVLPGKPEGVNPIRAFATTFDGAREVQEARRQVAKRRQVPGVWLRNTKRTLDGTTADVVATRAESKLRSGGVFASGADWELSVPKLPAQDVAFLESIKADANMIAAILTVPPELIGGTTGGSLTYNTVEGQLNWILTLTTRTWITKFEAAFTRAMQPGDYIKFRPDAVVRTDLKTRHEIFEIDRRIGLRNLDELRDLEDLQPLPDGAGQSYTPLALLGKADNSTREGSQ